MVPNGELLRKAENSDYDFVRELIRDWRSVSLPDSDRALLGFCEKLTFDPARIGPDDLDELRGHGFDDPDILHAVAIVASAAFKTRISLGLGFDGDSVAEQGSSPLLHADPTASVRGQGA